MAFGKSDNNDSSKLLIFRLRTKNPEGEKVDPYFEISAKEGGEWKQIDSAGFVNGNLAKADVKEGEWEGTKTYDVNLYLKDAVANETYLLSFRLNMLTRAIINSILNLPSTDDVKISLYTDKKGYPAAAVRQHGEMVRWKYSLDEMPKPESVTFKGKKMNDYTETDSFFVGKVKEFGVKLTSKNSGSVSATNNKKVTNKVEDFDPELDGGQDKDDVPF